MPVITTLKSSRTREKRALLKEETEAQRVLQTNVNDDQTEIRRHLLNIGKVLLNLEMKLSRLELANEKLSEAYEQANDTEGAEQFQLTLDEESEIIDGVIDKVSQLKILKEELEQRRRETETTGIVNSCSPQPIAPLRPPQLDITPFGGDILKWQEFWDAFEASVHNAKYAAVDKLNYLKSRLKGEALEAISGYQLSNENYTAVVDMLKKRFGNQQLIIDAHYRSLSNIPPATNQVSKLRQCYDTIECHLRSLEAVGEQVDHCHFVALILEKLPQKVRCQLYMQKPEDEEWTTPSLRKLLGKYISAMDMAGGESSEKQPTVSNPSRLVLRHHPLQPRPTAEGLLATNSKQNLKEVQIRCVYCSKPHWSDECPNYVTLQARRERLKGCCFNCLKKGHTLRDCTRDRACVHCGRRKNHHRSLCQRLFEEPTKQTSESQNISTIDDTGSVLMASSSHILMQTATVVVKNSQGDASEKIRLILDSGSQRSYITESVAKRLKLPLNSTERLSVVTFGTNKPKKIDCKLSKVQLSLQDKSTTTLNVTVVPNITGTIHRVPLKAEDLEFLKKRFNHDMLADSLPCHTESATIDMLIGNDYYFDLLEPQKLDLGGKLFLFNSKLGWILGGQTENTYARKTTVPSLLATTVGTVSVGTETTTPMFSNTDPSLACKPDLEQFWNLESIGIMDSPKMCDDDQALENFQKMIRHEDNRYFVTWPWKDSNPLLPDNYQLASGRLKSILGRLQKNPQLFQSYATIIQEQLERGIIEKVTSESVEGPNKHYIPHHAVITPTKSTTKVRVVYDASAKTKQTNKSLNECLYRGPVMLSDLCGLLIRFRLSPIAVIADIEKAFLSVGLQAADRDITRFLWLKDPTVMKLDNNVQIYRFCRVPFGVISSPFLLAATISYHLQQSDNQFAEVLKRDIYVDNIITGVNTIEKAKTLYNHAKSLFAAASMNLREWASNSQQFMECVPQCDQAANSEQKVLGIKWNLFNDTLVIPGNSTDKSRCVSTKREALHMTACIFDPLGFFAPTVLKAKLFMKKLWSERLGWDEKLGDGLLKEWLEISKQLESIPLYHLPRFIGITKMKSRSVEHRLVCFCDASGMAYATAIYLHQSSNDSCKADLIFSKTRLAPSDITIPRLELLAVLIGIRALKFVEKELQLLISGRVLFTDSICVLHWLKTTKPLSVFVTNRVKEIKSLTGVTYAHVPSQHNPADIATRGKSPDELTSSIWWKGPVWLAKPVQLWPDSRFCDNDSSPEIESEIKGSKSFYEAKLVCGEDSSGESVETKPNLSDIDETRYGSLFKLLRVTAWVLRFIDKLKKQGELLTGPLTAIEIQKAKLLWELHIQHEHYSEVICSIKRGRKNNIKHQLNLQLDTKGLLRCQGRLTNAELSQAAKYPKLLPKDAHFTQLVIEDVHRRDLHSGVSQALATVRQEYWIPHGRAVIKRILKICRVCRRVEGTPFAMPRMPDLPRERVARSQPFEYTGIDYFGPLYIKEFSQVTDRSPEQIERKVWVCLFTCFTIRAIHLELVGDMSAEEFLLCLRRFIARRGTPRQIFSDNAKQFKTARTVLARRILKQYLLEDVVTDKEVSEFAAYQGIQWRFIIELAPWMGGFYERLIGLTKRALKKTIGKKCLTERQLTTILTETEAVLNSRPLVYVDNDLDSSSALTPLDFLSLHSLHVIPDLTEETDPEFDFARRSSAKQLLQIWKRGQKHLNQFWKLWRSEYLLSLRERPQMSLKCPHSTAAATPRVGDVVLIKEDLPRGRWKVGRICELIQSRDQRIRSAKITVAPGKIIKRALNLLYPIECPEERDASKETPAMDSHASASDDRSIDSDDNEIEDDLNHDASVDQDTVPTTRPTRRAVIEARRKLQQWLNPKEDHVSLGSVADPANQ